jgi:hypothetical protein
MKFQPGIVWMGAEGEIAVPLSLGAMLGLP